MRKKNEGIVTYIKNGVQETVILNRWNRKKVFDKIFLQKGLVYDLYVNGDITYLEMKNVSFSNYKMCFGCINDTVVVFDNCEFCHIVSLKGSAFQLNHPVFKDEECEIRALYCDDLDINYFDLTGKKVSIDIKGGNNFSFDGNGCNIHNMNLENVYNVNLKNVNMDINNAEQNFYFNNLNGGSSLIAKNCNLNVYVGLVSNLFLKNTSFYCGNELGLYLDFDGLAGSDYSFSTIGDKISFNGIEFENNTRDELTFTDKDFIYGNVYCSRNNLIATLKKIRDAAMEKNHQSANLIEKQMMKRKIKNLSRVDK